MSQTDHAWRSLSFLAVHAAAFLSIPTDVSSTKDCSVGWHKKLGSWPIWVQNVPLYLCLQHLEMLIDLFFRQVCNNVVIKSPTSP